MPKNPLFITIFPDLPLSPLLQTIFAAAVLIVAAFTVYQIVWHRNRNRRQQETLSKIYTYRVYTIYMDTNQVVYFDKTNPRKVRSCDMDTFLKQYAAEDYYRVSNWLKQLINPKKEATWHLEAQAVLQQSKKTSLSVLEVHKVNQETKIIHLNSYLLRYLTPRKGGRSQVSNVITLQDANHRLEKASTNRGATYLIRFFYKKYQGNTGMYISSVFLKKLKDKITAFLSIGLYLVEQEASEIVLLETKNLTTNEHMQIAHSLAHTIVKYLEVSGLKDDISYTIGVVENKYFPHNFEELLHHARLMADLAERRDTIVAIYDRNQSFTEMSSKAVELEITDIIKARKYEIRFRPIVDVSDYQIEGYFSTIKIMSTLTESRFELARMFQDSKESHELLSNITRQVLMTFVDKRAADTQMLFFPVSVYERMFITKSLGMMKKMKDAHIVLVFDEVEINEWEANLAVISQMLVGFKEKGFTVAIAFSDMHLLLDNDIYKLFDYYILDHRMTGDILTNDRQRINVHALIEILGKFNRPIIATDMNDLESVELMVNFEVSMLSADCLSPYAQEVAPMETKTLNRIRQFERGKKN